MRHNRIAKLFGILVKKECEDLMEKQRKVERPVRRVHRLHLQNVNFYLRIQQMAAIKQKFPASRDSSIFVGIESQHLPDTEFN